MRKRSLGQKAFTGLLTATLVVGSVNLPEAVLKAQADETTVEDVENSKSGGDDTSDETEAVVEKDSKTEEETEESNTEEKKEGTEEKQEGTEEKQEGTEEKQEGTEDDEKTDESKDDEKTDESKDDEKTDESKDDEKADESKDEEKTDESKDEEKTEESEEKKDETEEKKDESEEKKDGSDEKKDESDEKKDGSDEKKDESDEKKDESEEKQEVVEEEKKETEEEAAKKKAEQEAADYIKELKKHSEKLDELTQDDSDAIKAIIVKLADVIDKYDIELNEEDEAFLEEFTGKFYEANIMTADNTVTADNIQSLIDAASGSITIELTQNVTKSIVIPSGKDITLKIGEGVTLSNDTATHTVTVKAGGTLTIESEGTIDNTSHARAALMVEENGTATIISGKIDRSKEAGKSAEDNGGNSYYYIRNHGKLTIEDVEISSYGKYSSLVENGYQDCSTENKNGYKPVLTIKDGSFSGGINTIKNDDDGILYISGGTFENTTQYALMNCNVAEISGGIFSVAEDSKYEAVWNRYAGNAEHDAGKMTITGGTFNNSIWSNAKSELDIQNIDAIDKIYISKDAKSYSLTAKPEKKNDDENSYSFLGWYNQLGNPVDNPGTLTGEADTYLYKPVYLSTKIKSESKNAELESHEASTEEKVSSAVEALIKNVVSGNTDESETTSKVEYETAEGVEDLAQEIKGVLTQGGSIEAVVVLKDADESAVTTEGKKAVEEAVGDKELAQFVNIDVELLVKKSEDENKKVANITKLDDEIEIVMNVPENLQASNRKFTVIRLHDDRAEALETETLESGKKIKFSSDKFSLYAVAYEDVKDTTDETKPDDSKTDDKTDDTKTDDTTNTDTNNNSETTDNSSNNSSSSSSGSGSHSRDKGVSKITGQWLSDDKGWWYSLSNGSYPKDSWYECTWNGVLSWYHFDEEGYADGGWFTDKDGQRYFLHDKHDGTFGAMYTGWKQIVDQWYYFNPEKRADGASKGSLVLNGVTPDGYAVDVNGAWIH